MHASQTCSTEALVLCCAAAPSPTCSSLKDLSLDSCSSRARCQGNRPGGAVHDAGCTERELRDVM